MRTAVFFTVFKMVSSFLKISTSQKDTPSIACSIDVKNVLDVAFTHSNYGINKRKYKIKIVMFINLTAIKEFEFI